MFSSSDLSFSRTLPIVVFNQLGELLEEIASFMHELRDLFECDSYTHQNLECYRQIIRPNDATLQSQFTLLLLEYLLTQANQEIIAPPSPIASSVYICQPVEDALKK